MTDQTGVRQPQIFTSKNPFTKAMFESYKQDSVISRGTVKNSPQGVYMTDNNIGKLLRWVAVKLYDSWTIYTHWADYDEEYILLHGDTVCDKINIRKLVFCDDETLNLYGR